MPNTPLNTDALRKKIEAFCENMAETGQMDRMKTIDLLIEAQEHLATAQPVVNSVEELDQLPIGSLIMMSGVVAPFLHTDDGWESTRTPGKPVWDYTTNPSYLPARVLYRP